MIESGGIASIEEFATPRLRAARLRADHLPDIRRMHQDPRLMRSLGGLRGEAETTDYLRCNLAHWDQHGFGVWLLRDAERDRLVGRVCLRHLVVESVEEIELGYALLPDCWGQGLATEIARATVTIGLDRLGCRSLVGLTLPENLASQRVLMKADMSYQRDVLHREQSHRLYRITRG